MTKRAIGLLVPKLSGDQRVRHEADMHREAQLMDYTLTMIAYAEEMNETAFVRLINLVIREDADAVYVPDKAHFNDHPITALTARVDVYCLDDCLIFTGREDSDLGGNFLDNVRHL